MPRVTLPSPVLPLTQEATERRNRPTFVSVEQQSRTAKTAATPNAAGDDAPAPTPAPAKSRRIGPLIQVLPYSTRVSDIDVQRLDPNSNKYPDGTLAWGNIDSATLHCHHFDALIVTAEEFPFNDEEFISNAFHTRSRCKSSVYFVPISEVRASSSDSLRDKNHALQHVLRVQKSKTEPIGLKTTNVMINRRYAFSNQLIYSLLMEKKTILVVCMAGRNRSTTTILMFLMMLPLMPSSPNETDLLQKTRKCFPKTPAKWLEYLNSKRTTEIFEINRIQLETLLRTITALTFNPT